MASQASILLEKNPPQSLEAEKAIIASMLIDREAIVKIADQVNSDNFYHEGHKYIIDSILELYEKEEPVDLVTVNNLLKDNQIFQRIGGAAYLNELVEYIPTSAHVEYYLKIIQDKGLLRTLINICTGIVSDAYQGNEEASDLADKAESKIFDVARNRVKEDLVPIKPVLNETIQFIEKRYHNQGSYSGVPTGFVDLDNLTGGLQKSDLVIIAARPSMGKTAFCLNVTENVSMRFKQGIIFFSLEMSKHQLCQRLLSSHARIDSQVMRKGNIKPGDFPKITNSVNQLSQAKIYIDDTPAVSTLEIRAKARRLMAREEISLVIIDYLQLITLPPNKRTDNRQNEIAEISRSLKALARELDAPVIAISQLSRGVESRAGDHRPRLSDLRDSGAIEQDADIVAFIYRDEYYHPDDESVKGKAELIIAKQRNGPTGTVEMAFSDSQTRFDNLARE